MSSYTLSFIQYLLGLRGPTTLGKKEEHDFLGKFLPGKKTLVEVGVYEGVASRALCSYLDPNAKLYLIDPYYQSVTAEKLLGFSFAEYIAKQNVKGYAEKVEFVRMTSVEAAKTLPLKNKVDFVFIDAMHDYESVLEDFTHWAPMLAPAGLIAFHDSHICSDCHELNENVGPVRLCKEIAQGKHGDWKIIDILHTVTIITKNTAS